MIGLLDLALGSLNSLGPAQAREQVGPGASSASESERRGDDERRDLPVYSAMEVMEEAVEPLSQSLSTVRLVLRLPGNDSTESQLEVNERVRVMLVQVKLRLKGHKPLGKILNLTPIEEIIFILRKS